MRTVWLLALFILPACSCPGATLDEGNGDDAGTLTDGGRNQGGGGGAGGGSGGGGGGTACAPPHFMILLDRTGTMHRDLTGATPPNTDAGRESSKLWQAISAIDSLVLTPGVDQTMQFGLTLFPRDPGGTSCITLEERLDGGNFTNPACEAGQVVTAPALGTGTFISNALDPATTRLCFSTPTGEGLVTAMNQLRSMAQPGTRQFVMLVTDGADFYDSCPTPDPMVVLRQMQLEGVDTYILGFGGQDTTPQGVNPPLLNRMACAGHTAKGFGNNCVELADGGYDAVNPDGGRLYYDAANAAELQTALESIATQVCCNCIF